MKYIMVLLVLVSFNAHAKKMYKCKDAAGKFTYSVFQCENEKDTQPMTVKKDPARMMDYGYRGREYYDAEFDYLVGKRKAKDRAFVRARNARARDFLQRSQDAEYVSDADRHHKAFHKERISHYEDLRRKTRKPYLNKIYNDAIKRHEKRVKHESKYH